MLDRKFKRGDTYYGIPAYSPLEYKPTDDDKKDAVVVITVVTKKYHEEIFNCLSQMGFKNIVLSTDIYEYHLSHPSKEWEREDFTHYCLDNQKQIERSLDLFTDDLSRKVFTSVIQTHMLKKPVPIPCSTPEDQYFPKDCDLRKGYARFIHAGAYDGKTIMRLNALFGKIDTIACFEPDMENFKVLARYLSDKHNEIAQTVIAFPCGVFSHETQTFFEGGSKDNSAISDKGESIIQCVALDHALPGFNPTFISMDVEGVECEALKGCEKLIKESKPDLAICVYHSPNHMWDIPLYIESLHLGYKFYLRNCSSFVAETVLYATVTE